MRVNGGFWTTVRIGGSPAPAVLGWGVRRSTGWCWTPAGAEESGHLQRAEGCVWFTQQMSRNTETWNRRPLTKSLPDQVQLIHVGLPGPQRNSRQEFGKNTPDGPDVHGGAVLRVPHQQLGGPVPAGGHVVRVVVTGPGWGSTERDESQNRVRMWVKGHVKISNRLSKPRR